MFKMENLKLFYRILSIVVIAGWIGFLFYNIHLWNYLIKQYEINPSNFVMFDNEKHKEQYKNQLSYKNHPSTTINWINKSSLVSDCKPLIYINDFFFDKISGFLKFTGFLIILTILTKTNPAEWRRIGDKIDKINKKIEQEQEK